MSKYSKTQRFIVAIGCVIVFTLSKLIITSLEITWDVVLIATLMPSVVGLGVYWYMGVQIKPLQPFFKSKQFAINKNQDWAYEQAALEVENNSMDKAMWARVFAQCDGDENKVRARYINKRVEWLLLEKRISDKESFVETDESKRSRIKIQRFFLGITALVFVIYIASVIQTLIASNDKADTTGHKGFEPDTYLKEKGWGASDQIINKPINSSTKPRLTFDQ